MAHFASKANFFILSFHENNAIAFFTQFLGVGGKDKDSAG
jgi:hypothetical protein